MKRTWLNVTGALAIIAGAACATFVGFAAWDHNPQGAYHDWETGTIDWDGFGPIIGFWFAVPALLVFLFSGVVYVAVLLFRKLMS